MGSDFYSYDQESRCKTSCTTIYKLGAKWGFRKKWKMNEIKKKKNGKYLRINVPIISDDDHLIKKPFCIWTHPNPTVYQFVVTIESKSGIFVLS